MLIQKYDEGKRININIEDTRALKKNRKNSSRNLKGKIVRGRQILKVLNVQKLECQRIEAKLKDLKTKIE